MITEAMGNKRLLRLAEILEAVPRVHDVGAEKRGYDQARITHPCGSPACAWGHWLLSSPARTRRIYKEAEGNGTLQRDHGLYGKAGMLLVYINQSPDEFYLTRDEQEELFDWDGCGGAKTGKQAAKYIRNFVAQRQKAAAK